MLGEGAKAFILGMGPGLKPGGVLAVGGAATRYCSYATGSVTSRNAMT